MSCIEKGRLTMWIIGRTVCMANVNEGPHADDRKILTRCCLKNIVDHEVILVAKVVAVGPRKSEGLAADTKGRAIGGHEWRGRAS